MAPFISWVVEADFDKNGSYETDLTAYVRRPGNGITIDRGMGWGGAYQISKTVITLDNRDGRFNSLNPSSPLHGKLEPDVPIRIKTTIGVTTYVAWTGYIRAYKLSGITPKGQPLCRLECEDIAVFLAESDLINVTYSTSRDTDGALIAIMDAMGLTAGDRSFDDGVQDLPTHYCLAQNALAAMSDVVRSEMGGYLWVNADGQLRFENRNSRLGTTVAATFGDSTGYYPVSASVLINADDYVTAVRARATVFRLGQADTEIFRFSRSKDTYPTADSIQLAAGETYERDFDTQSAVAAIVAPVAGTDYLANDAANGSGTDRTSSLTVTVVDRGAGRFNLKIKNGHSGAVYLTKFRLRGQPGNFFADRPEFYASLAVPGRKAGKVVEIDVPFGGDGGQKLRDYAYSLMRTYRWPIPQLQATFIPRTTAEAETLLALDIGDRARYKDTALGAEGTYTDEWMYIESIKMAIPPTLRGRFTTTFNLSPSYIYRKLDGVVFDVFGRANATGDLGTATSDDVWADDGNMDISSNAARANSDTAQVPSLDLGAGNTDHVVEVSLSAISTGDEVGLSFRKVDTSNYYRAYVDQGSNEVILEKVVAGVTTELSSPAFTVGTSHEMRVIVQGTRIRVWVDRYLYIDTTDSSLTTGTKVGLFHRNANATAKSANFYGQGL